MRPTVTAAITAVHTEPPVWESGVGAAVGAGMAGVEEVVEAGRRDDLREAAGVVETVCGTDVVGATCGVERSGVVREAAGFNG
jgi:hypothetical protein